jgi:tRNA pseudouridine32 synthase / 23S rRNA pseudouridine746 synthase
MSADIPIVYVNADLLLVDKPAGLLSVPGRGADKSDCALLRVQRIYADALVVHRLDQPTSGLMLMARNARMQRMLSRLFELRQVNKNYCAIVHGLLAEDEGRIDLPLSANWPLRPLQQVDATSGKPASTRFRVLERHAATQTSRLALEPLTGRTHQLRVHLQAIGHPIVGDTLYGKPDKASRLHLHAQSLTFLHPIDQTALAWRIDAAF